MVDFKGFGVKLLFFPTSDALCIVFVVFDFRRKSYSVSPKKNPLACLKVVNSKDKYTFLN